MKVKKTLILVFATICSLNLSAQQENTAPPKSAPIPVELFMSSKNYTLQLVIDKKFNGSNKLGFFGLSYLRANYDNDKYLEESINLATLKYELFKGISVMSGALINSHWGFRPYAGVQYAYHSKIFMGMVNSGFHLTETKNFETIAMLEYRPAIVGAWSLYTRAQGMYSLNTVAGEHDRSHLYGRIGVSYKAYTIGGALNYDKYLYGPMQIKDHQWGLFLSTLL